MVNTSYVSMDEHLVCYWCSTFLTPMAKMKNQTTGCREEIEANLISFLHSLKYYSTRWLRAKNYAELAGFLSKVDQLKQVSEVPAKTHLPPENILEGKINDLRLGDMEIRRMDIYSQEFFLYAYSKIIIDRSNFLESQEGNTYIK